MKKWQLLFLLTPVFLLSGCSLLEGDDKNVNDARVLNNSPFQFITDSIRESPSMPELYLKRGAMLMQKNFTALAVFDYKKAWTLRPDEQTALLYTAGLFMTGKDKEAILLLKDCKDKFPGNSEFPRRLSEAYMQNGESKEALDQFNHLIQVDSGNYETWYERGLLLAQLRDTSHAIQSLERAFSLQPLQIVSLSLANLYAEVKDKRALTLCDDVIVKDSAQELTDPFFIKGIYYSNTNQHDLAMEQFERCISRDWKFTDAYIEKGIILFEEENIDEALKTFALAARVSNTYPDAYYWMGRCYENIGKKQEARDSYMRALVMDRNFKEAKESLKRLN